MIDVFTPKMISPDYLFKSNHRQVSISILILWFAIYLCGMLHTAEIISAECCTPRRSSSRCVAHRRDNSVIEYLDRIKTEFENTLAYLSDQLTLHTPNLLTVISTDINI